MTPLPAGVELRFDGARLATMNDLLAMTVRERYRYRAAWHTLVRDAALEAYAGRPPIFHAVSLTLTRQGPRDIDSDAIVPKAPIDGLRYAGFIPDDTQDVVRRLSLNPARGAYAVVILLSAWEQEHN